MNSKYKFVNLLTNQSIHVSKEFFDSSELTTEVFHGETECYLPGKIYLLKS
jgi:hypothetical protein